MSELTDSDKKLIADIESHGWHVIKVVEDEQGPCFGYSIGFYKTFDHPEIIIIGLNLDLVHSLINSIGEEIRAGNAFLPGQFYPDLLEGFDCYFTTVKREHYKAHVGYGSWYYKGDDFPLLQCIYPTSKGIYPWQAEWPESIKDLQPLLGLAPGR